jgi:anti-anti-sigma regulatory factor
VSSGVAGRLFGVDPDVPGELFFVVDRPAALQQVDALCARVHAAIRSAAARVLVCDVSALDEADELALETVARLRLTARRTHASMRLVGVAPQLDDLLDAAGLAGIVRERWSGLEPTGHAEEREQFGVDEEVDAGDLPV